MIPKRKQPNLLTSQLGITPCAASKENGAHTASTVCALQSEYL